MSYISSLICSHEDTSSWRNVLLRSNEIRNYCKTILCNDDITSRCFIYKFTIPSILFLHTYKQGMYLKYFYLKHSICNTSVFCIFYFSGSHKSILYLKLKDWKLFVSNSNNKVIINVSIWNTKYFHNLLLLILKYKIQNTFIC